MFICSAYTDLLLDSSSNAESSVREKFAIIPDPRSREAFVLLESCAAAANLASGHKCWNHFYDLQKLILSATYACSRYVRESLPIPVDHC